MKVSYTQALIDSSKLEETAKSLNDYRAHLQAVSEKTDYVDPECSLHLPFDEQLLIEVRKIVQAIKTPTLQYIVVVGIGGSNLGTQAVYNAIAGSMNLLIDRLPKILFLDTVSDERMTAVTRELTRTYNKEDFAILIISKSGGTTEVMANAETLVHELKEQFGSVKDRVVGITAEGSKLWNELERQRALKISLPDNVGGRYSVFSSVGLVPLMLANIDIDELRSGARDAIKDGLSEELNTNHALVSACLNYLHNTNGRTIHNTFLFSTKLEVVGKWYRQLMGESIGKEKDLNGNTVHAGMTPIVSIGSTDLHSMAQLYYGGPDDKFTNIIYSFSGEVNRVPMSLAMPGLVKDIQGKHLEDIMEAIVGGVKSAYEQKQRPYMEIDLEQIVPYQLGYYLQFRMMEMMYLAKLMNVNAFDQPAVELYKDATRQLLQN
jgi:glucose-6-phosphate isomerase